MAEIPNVRLSLSSRAENVLLVRQALNGLAETIGLDPLELNDISTAVSEACNNVAMHAYDGVEGPLELEIYVGPTTLRVVVRDRGVGISPLIEDAESSGIGLPIMLALAQSVEFRDLDGHGTEVRLEFATTARTDELERPAPGAWALDTLEHGARSDVTALTLSPAMLARTVLPRLLSALAARAFFSTDRISDAQLLADALVAHTDETLSGRQLSIDISVAPRELELRLGPLQAGRTSALDDDGLGLLLARLAESHEVHSAAAGEVLALRLVDNARG